MKVSSLALQPRSLADIGLGSAIAALLTGIWFIGDFHGRQDTDSLIHPLNSLYLWTLFVWEYDHNGSLLSAAAQIITRPYWNVVAISALSSLLFLTGLALWASLISPITLTEGSLWVALLLPILLTQHAVFQIASHSVTSGVALFFSGLYVYILQRHMIFRDGQWLIPGLFLLAFLATYLSKIAFFPMAAVTVGLLWANRPLPWKKVFIICGCLTLALLCYQFFEQASPFRKDYTLQIVSLPVALPRLLANWGSNAMTGIAWLAAPALMLLYKPARHNAIFPFLVAGIVIETLVISCSRWTATNSFAAYYLFDLSFLSLFAVLGLGVALVRRWLPRRTQRSLMIALGLAALCLNVYTWKAYRPVDPFIRIEQAIGKNTPAMAAAGCDLIVGDYWTAWPAMLAVNDYYYRNDILDPQSGGPRKVYAISYLAASTEDLWWPVLNRANARICSLSADEVGYLRYLIAYAPEVAYETVAIAQFAEVVVHQVQDVKPLESITLDFDSPAPGDGWSYPEVTPSGETFLWASLPTTTLVLPFATDHDAILEFRVIMAMAPDILDGLTLIVNDEPIQLESVRDEAGAKIFRGTIARSILAVGSQPVVLTFHIDRTLIPQFVLPHSDDMRTLGLAFDWLHIQAGPGP